MKQNGKWKAVIFILIVVGILIGNHYFGWSDYLGDMNWLMKIKDSVEDNTAAVFAIYTVITIIGCVVLALPGVTFALFAGMLFGPWKGILACLFATTLGAAMAFLVGRFFLKDAVKPMLEKNKILKKLLFTKDGKSELVVLMITRMVPIFPYNLQNFAYGITDIGFWKYTAYTFVFMFPGVSFFTIGAAGLTAGEDKWKYFLTAAVLAVLVTAAGLLIRKKFLKEEPEERTQAVILFTRVPEAGKTKTRLMPYLTGEECKELHMAFLKDIRMALQSVQADRYVFFTPPEKEAEIRELLPDMEGYYPQSGDTLGDRMQQAFEEIFRKNYQKAVLTGTDIPQLTAADYEEAMKLLDTNDVVISPTEDGGYYLIGMKAAEDIFDVPHYGTNTVWEDTVANIEKRGRKAGFGNSHLDIDTKEDLEVFTKRLEEGKVSAPHTEAWLKQRQREECIHCGKCTRSCLFLEKYHMDLKGFLEHPELAYHCFLCGRCTAVCPKGIDGREIALQHREQKVKSEGNRVTDPAYRAILWEKNPYQFANYKNASYESVLFTGCNFVSFYPKTADYLIQELRQRGIGVLYECCGKPTAELGAGKDAEVHLQQMERRLKEAGVKELIMVCPNCYYYMKGRVNLRLVSIYDKLAELGMGQRIPGGLPFYYPCPDREEKVFLKGIRRFMEAEERDAFPEVQCCGLGGCAVAKEPALAKEMEKLAEAAGEAELYTYCASCVSNFRRNGYGRAEHVLSKILNVQEKVPLGVTPILHRAVRKWK